MLPIIVIVLGLVHIVVAVAIVRSVDEGLPSAAEAARPIVGPPVESPRSTLDAAQATRFTMLGVVVAVLGAGNLMIGTQLLVLRLIEQRAKKSRLGSDPKP
ncbi:MAG: hypothetical protein JNK58_13865 [Phycisphaerae bacterium]|nr:hypothetical protein [Phycisphaerae bacterium]